MTDPIDSGWSENCRERVQPRFCGGVFLFQEGLETATQKPEINEEPILTAYTIFRNCFITRFTLPVLPDNLPYLHPQLL